MALISQSCRRPERADTRVYGPIWGGFGPLSEHSGPNGCGNHGRVAGLGHCGRRLAQSQAWIRLRDHATPNRVGVTHHKSKAAVEAKLRRDVGSQMWLIVGALKEIDSSP